MTSNLFITGNSSGVGYALSELFLNDNWQVYGLSRRGYPKPDENLHDSRCNLADPEAIPRCLDLLLGEVKHLELAVLNAGMLGQIKDLSETSLPELEQIMQVNVWANKQILDWLLKSDISITQVLLISSGAAVNGSRGWGGYSLSKATLNMLTRLYAHEFPHTHISALAPGLIDTAMQAYLCDPTQVDSNKYPSVERLRAAKDTSAMPSPMQAAELIVKALPRLRQLESGSFADIRDMPLE